MGEQKYSPNTLTLSLRWARVVSFTHLPLYPRGNHPPFHTRCVRIWLGIRTGFDVIDNRNILTITIPDIIHRPVLYLKLNSIGLSVPHRKHITSPLRAQQVNGIHRFVTMVY
jgi:hypothetical protein